MQNLNNSETLLLIEGKFQPHSKHDVTFKNIRGPSWLYGCKFCRNVLNGTSGQTYFFHCAAERSKLCDVVLNYTIPSLLNAKEVLARG